MTWKVPEDKQEPTMCGYTAQQVMDMATLYDYVRDTDTMAEIMRRAKLERMRREHAELGEKIRRVMLEKVCANCGGTGQRGVCEKCGDQYL